MIEENRSSDDFTEDRAIAKIHEQDNSIKKIIKGNANGSTIPAYSFLSGRWN
jgi:hypothetical protein